MNGWTCEWDTLRQCNVWTRGGATRRTYHHDDGTWSISENDTWLPGLYDTEETAMRAARLPDLLLSQVAVVCAHDGEDRPVTLADLEAAEARRGSGAA